MLDLVIVVSVASAVGSLIALGLAVFHHLRLEQHRHRPGDR